MHKIIIFKKKKSYNTQQKYKLKINQIYKNIKSRVIHSPKDYIYSLFHLYYNTLLLIMIERDPKEVYFDYVN